MANHRDADVYRFCIAQQEARTFLAESQNARQAPAEGPAAKAGRNIETVTVSAKQHGPEALLAMARMGGG